MDRECTANSFALSDSVHEEKRPQLCTRHHHLERSAPPLRFKRGNDKSAAATADGRSVARCIQNESATRVHVWHRHRRNCSERTASVKPCAFARLPQGLQLREEHHIDKVFFNQIGLGTNASLNPNNAAQNMVKYLLQIHERHQRTRCVETPWSSVLNLDRIAITSCPSGHTAQRRLQVATSDSSKNPRRHNHSSRRKVVCATTIARVSFTSMCGQTPSHRAHATTGHRHLAGGDSTMKARRRHDLCSLRPRPPLNTLPKRKPSAPAASPRWTTLETPQKTEIAILLRPHTHLTWLVHQRSGECDDGSGTPQHTKLRTSNNGRQPNRHLLRPKKTTRLEKRTR